MRKRWPPGRAAAPRQASRPGGSAERPRSTIETSRARPRISWGRTECPAAVRSRSATSTPRRKTSSARARSGLGLTIRHSRSNSALPARVANDLVSLPAKPAPPISDHRCVFLGPFLPPSNAPFAPTFCVTSRSVPHLTRTGATYGFFLGGVGDRSSTRRGFSSIYFTNRPTA